MPEILTESFCERCGTKYSLEASVPRRPGGIKRAKIVARGLKNYVLSEDAFEESLEGAKLEEDKDRAAGQLDAFHKVFNFCMDCRQYTCQGCWNEQESRCLSCAPLADRWATDPLVIAEQQATAEAAAAENGRAALDAAAWPTVDLAPQPEPAWPTAYL